MHRRAPIPRPVGYLDERQYQRQVNASALGRIGVLVARSAPVMRVFVRQRAYLHFLAEVQKNTFRTENALVLTAEQFTECLAGIPRRQA
jgi:hypothetical protein